MDIQIVPPWICAAAGWCLLCFFTLPPRSTGVEPEVTPDHPPALSPDVSAKRFKVPDDLSISLVVAEPDVSQPLSISFDGRGRMWVLQYLQYPNPNGLKAVEMDNWLRTKYDKIPDPPPNGPKGRDRISIYEDRDGDGRAEVGFRFAKATRRGR